MADPYLGEIRLFAGNFAPVGWMFCNGQLLAISENDALFALIGTTYGGDGVTTFGLPNLQSRIPVHQGQGIGLTNRVLGQSSGQEMVTLNANEIPAHTHSVGASKALGHLSDPTGAVPARHRDFPAFAQAYGVPMAATSTTSSGGNQPHDNMPPYLCVSFIIAVWGIFPSRN